MTAAALHAQHQERDAAGFDRLAIFALLHLPLGYLLGHSALFSSIHALATLAVGFTWALDTERPHRVAVVCAYIAGFDVFWRMSDALVFHQFGKYAVILLMLVWMMRAGAWRRALGPAVYFLLLLPSIAVAADVATIEYIKGRASFNLSGPLSLAVAVMFFRQVEWSRDTVARLLLACVTAIVAVLAVTIGSTLAADSIQFTAESNFVTSGGYGPNQVSAMLGVGALLLLLLPAVRRPHGIGVLLVALGVLAFLMQCALTFSRGGLYGAAGAMLASLPFFLSDDRFRMRVAPVLAALTLLAVFVVLPSLDHITDGKFLERMGETRMAGREDLMMRDVALWEENPILGVGPGMSKLSQLEGMKSMIAHTEFTRLVAEHGTLGILAILVLLVIGAASVVGAPPGVPRAIAVACVTWSFLFMTHAAMRLVGPGFLFGVAAGIGCSRAEDWDSDEPEWAEA